MGDLRLATRDDNAALLELFGEVPMSGSLVLSTRRDPDFFRLYDMQRATADCWVVEEPGKKGLTAMSATLVREGWLEGKPCKVGYLGDLRTSFAGRRDRSVLKFYSKVFADARERRGCDVFLTGVLASNSAALNALVRRRKARATQPVYSLIQPFSMISIQFAGKRQTKASGIEVRTATAADLPTWKAMLAADHHARPFGYRYDEGELEHRLAAWPGYSLDETYLAFKDGQLLGGTTVWDSSPVKRNRVMAYRGGMLWTKRGFNAAASLLGWTRLPEPGQDFRFFYLCGTSVAGDDPVVLRALIDRVYADHRTRGYHFFSLLQYDGDPLAPAVKGFLTRKLDFNLYAVTAPDAPPLAVPKGRTGFEMALA